MDILSLAFIVLVGLGGGVLLWPGLRSNWRSIQIDACSGKKAALERCCNLIYRKVLIVPTNTGHGHDARASGVGDATGHVSGDFHVGGPRWVRRRWRASLNFDPRADQSWRS